MASYDKYYKEKNYFGKAYKELVSFFREYPSRGKVLDLGCGQGRDSIEIAKLDYEVTGVDISTVGIDQMLIEAKKLALNVKGQVSDIYTYDKINDYDFILLDSMLHFYSKDKKKETFFYNKILQEMKIGSVFCNLLLKSKKNEEYIKSLVEKNEYKFEVLFDGYAQYVEADCEYHMYVVKKNK